jgi:hypothetical protein
MDHRILALIVFVCVFGSAMFGFLLGKVVPDRHLSSDSKDIVKLATGLIATLSALVLGLLVSSAKGTFDQVNNELTQVAAKTVLLDRALAQYGPETNEIRAGLKSNYTTVMEQLTSGDESQQANLESSESFRRFERLYARIRALTPQNDVQRGLQSRAIQIAGEMNDSRWFLTMGRTGSISMPLFVTMVFWLSLIFAAWGMVSPRNLVVATALFGCAVAVSGAVLLILEMNQPLSGWIRVSPIPLQKAFAHLGE